MQFTTSDTMKQVYLTKHENLADIAAAFLSGWGWDHETEISTTITLQNWYSVCVTRDWASANKLMSMAIERDLIRNDISRWRETNGED